MHKNIFMIFLVLLVWGNLAWANKPVVVSSTAKDLQSKEQEKQVKLSLQYFDSFPAESVHYLSAENHNKLKDVITHGKFKNTHFPGGKLKNPKGEQFAFLSDAEVLVDLGASIEAQKNLANQYSQYSELFHSLASIIQNNLVTPEIYIKMNSSERDQAEREMADFIRGNINQIASANPQSLTTPPTYWKEKCSDELGGASSTYTDTADNARRCADTKYLSYGLHKNIEYAQKYNHTCIKSQAARGTCVGFAITAAVEALTYQQKHKAANLSEQFTYAYGEIYGGIGRYEYGLNVSYTLSVLNSKNAPLQYENKWYYNPSYDIAADVDSSNQYANSCASTYKGQMCTNYAFQCTETASGSWPFTSYSYTLPTRSTTKWEVTGKTSYWNILSKQGSIDKAITLVNAGTPVILGYEVLKNFSDTTDGFVRWESNQENVGGHAVLLIGYVPNSDLPSGAPKAVGDGYFIMKNSWGTWNGDCGYYYLDDEYIKQTTTSLHTITASIPSI